MELIKLKLLDTDGMTLLTGPAAGQVSLVYMNAYKPGDRVSLEIGTPGQYVVIQFEDTMAPALVYVVKREINFHIPFGEQAITYSPKSFAGACHIIRARFATPEEIATRRNLAYNPYDEHGDTGFFPHAHANVETRGEAVFAARNAIDGIYENDAHGIWPYQSWGINRDPNAALTLDFGRPVATYKYVSCYFGGNGHRGTDYAAPGGTEIYAVSGGVVTAAAYHWSWGYYVQVYHGKDDNGNTYSTLYAHMNSAPVVSVGQPVEKGKVLGYVGSTGNSTGNHLHLEMKVNNVLVNVMNYLS